MNDITGIADFVQGINTAYVEPTDDVSEASDDGGDDYITNRHGERFDPSIHVTNEDGSPKLTKHGRFRHRPGRKSGSSSTDNDAPERDPNLTLAAETAATLYIQSGVLLFGHEWLPNPEKMEREQLVAAFEAYFEAKGVIDIPPGVALAIALFGYAAPRLYMPETQTRLQRATMWLKLKLGWMKYNAPRIDSRADRLRKDDASKNDGEKRGWWRRSGTNS